MEEMEKISNTDFSKAYKLNIYNQLAKVEAFNYFLNDKLKTSKRFGIEGLDCAIAGLSIYLLLNLDHLVETAADMGVDYIGMGMAHRGRLSCLANVFQKPMVKIFSEFQ
jgi:2-oxoglutarate dehydrogenase E1 component